MSSDSNSSVPIAVLYSFPGSCYASAAQLALIEKVSEPSKLYLYALMLIVSDVFPQSGLFRPRRVQDCQRRPTSVDACSASAECVFHTDDTTMRPTVNGANFSPEFLKINSKGQSCHL